MFRQHLVPLRYRLQPLPVAGLSLRDAAHPLLDTNYAGVTP